MSGTRWIEVVRHLAAEDPRVVSPATVTSAARNCSPMSATTSCRCARRPGCAGTRP
ncbi:hypothetical protein SAZ11_11185 [Streptomyces sp. FXJ1.4098]|nr:hypothetical protein [Streptomyces sp. FXJ1.4098]